MEIVAVNVLRAAAGLYGVPYGMEFQIWVTEVGEDSCLCYVPVALKGEGRFVCIYRLGMLSIERRWR